MVYLHVHQQQTNVNSLVDLRSPREKKWIEPGDLRQCWNNLFEIPTEVVLRHDKERQCLAPRHTCKECCPRKAYRTGWHTFCRVIWLESKVDVTGDYF
jgi:hypothetical protein